MVSESSRMLVNCVRNFRGLAAVKASGRGGRSPCQSARMDARRLKPQWGLGVSRARTTRRAHFGVKADSRIVFPNFSSIRSPILTRRSQTRQQKHESLQVKGRKREYPSLVPVSHSAVGNSDWSRVRELYHTRAATPIRASVFFSRDCLPSLSF